MEDKVSYDTFFGKQPDKDFFGLLTALQVAVNQQNQRLDLSQKGS